MKTNKFFSTLIFLHSALLLLSQNVVGYEDGRIDSFEQVVYKNPIFESAFLSADELKIPIEDIRSFENSHGYFRKQNIGLKNIIFLKDFDGDKMDTYFMLPTPMFPDNYKQKKLWFSKNDGPIMRLNPKWLRRNTRDCIACQEILKKSKTKDRIRIVMFSVGTILFIDGAFDFLKSGWPSTDENISPIGFQMFGGVWLTTGSLFWNRYRKKDTQKVMKIYNE